MKLDNSVEEGIVQVVESKGFECYEVKYFRSGDKTILRVFADSDTGITMDECADISRALSEYLDEVDFGKSEYTLEVSSPGLDRPLTTERDYRRFIGKTVQVRFRNEKGNARKFTGAVKSVNTDGVVIENEKEEQQFQYDQILNGKVII